MRCGDACAPNGHCCRTWQVFALRACTYICSHVRPCHVDADIVRGIVVASGPGIRSHRGAHHEMGGHNPQGGDALRHRRTRCRRAEAGRPATTLAVARAVGVRFGSSVGGLRLSRRDLGSNRHDPTQAGRLPGAAFRRRGVAANRSGRGGGE